MPQAHRIKPQSPAVWTGVIRFLRGILREISFWLLVVIALGMIVALLTFHPEDPAWTHTAQVTKIHNSGGTVGAWFADISLYFFGYPAYWVPLGLIWAAWRLFKRKTLMVLDAEIVVFRVLGFIVALLMACGLAAAHLQPIAGAGGINMIPAGGLVGVHVSQFLIKAFGPMVGNLFMLALLLAGLTLTTDWSWLKVLDSIGHLVLRALAWITTPTAIPQPRDSDEADPDQTLAAPPALPPGKTGRSSKRTQGKARTFSEDSISTHQPAEPSAVPTTSKFNQFSRQAGSVVKQGLAHGWRSTAAGVQAWWQQRQMKLKAQADAETASAGAAPTTTESQPLPETQSPTTAGRNNARIEPVLNLPRRRGEPDRHVASPVNVPIGVDSTKSVLPDLTLIPTAVAPPQPLARPTPVMTPPSSPGNTAVMLPALQDYLVDDRVPTSASNDATMVKAPPPKVPSIATVASASPIATMVRRVALPAAPELALLPTLDLLDQPPLRTAGYAAATLEAMSRQVENLLKSFGVDARVVAVEPGPVITRFEVDPAPGVKVSQISNLSKDLARGLSVISVRVVEVIPGKSVIGLEIPNQHRQTVYLREVLEAPVYTESAASLTLALGMDIGGNPIVANLAKMPHLLVAGTTGSGKSVAINAMLLSLLYKAPPAEVRLILVDPKMLELSVYEDIPHLLTPVVTDMKEAANALRWCVGEMERRYRLMAALKVRNITGFNRKVLDALADGEGLTDPFWKPDEVIQPGEIPLLQPLPSIVVVIDELADMMMIVGKKVEELIARLAQKARAAGIHLILATQRPSVDVITGLIKANIPTRIAFQVSSKVDSRTILDQMGAEQLLGHGDMLYLPPGTGLPQRVHGAFVDDQEVNRVVDFLRQTGAPDYIDEVLVEARDDSEAGEEGENGNNRGGESDPLYDEAVKIVTESRRASVSGVQRRLRIGYNRAARLVEEMEVAGVVGPLQSNGSREVLAPPPP